jgi:hypothetical protein
MTTNNDPNTAPDPEWLRRLESLLTYEEYEGLATRVRRLRAATNVLEDAIEELRIACSDSPTDLPIRLHVSGDLDAMPPGVGSVLQNAQGRSGLSREAVADAIYASQEADGSLVPECKVCSTKLPEASHRVFNAMGWVARRDGWLCPLCCENGEAL